MDTGYGQSRLLGAGGLTELDERVYRQLLASNGASMSDLGEAVGASPRRVRYALEALEQAGLVSRAGNRPVRYVPAPPEAAVEMLVARRQEETERLRLAAKALAQEYQAGQAAASFREVVETIAPGEAGVNRQYQLLMGAKQELLSFNRRPKRPDQRFIDFKLSILERGVVARGIYTPEALEVPGVVDFIEAVGRVGEHSRVVNGLPTHLLVVDRRVGFTPLEAGRGPLLGGSLILHESPLLDALVAFFECLWKQATPVELWDEAREMSHNGQSAVA